MGIEGIILAYCRCFINNLFNALSQPTEGRQRDFSIPRQEVHVVVCGWCTDFGLHHLPSFFPPPFFQTHEGPAKPGLQPWQVREPGLVVSQEKDQPQRTPAPHCAHFSACLPVCFFPRLISCLDSSSPRACSFKQTKICPCPPNNHPHPFRAVAFSRSRRDGLQIQCNDCVAEEPEGTGGDAGLRYQEPAEHWP